MDRGAHYIKADLQVHTPRDQAWNGSYTSDVDRQDFARAFVAACRKASLGAVAITDHHDLAFVPYIREAAETEMGTDGAPLPVADRLVVFPGLELTVAVPCQLLLIFSADFPTDRLSAVLEKLDIEPAEAGEAKGRQPRQLALKTIGDLYERLDQTSWLRGQYIVLPNVTDGGHQTLMRAGMYGAYSKMPCVGGYVDGPVTKIGEGKRRIFEGLDAQWGNKRIAVIQTSDARSFDSLGSNATWIKWAEPTAEALRQACLAQESRIAHVDPPLPSVHITSLVVSNSKFLGPVTLELNPQYNALIGGRGTGKSSVLEYLRWGLCDEPPLPGAPDGGGPDFHARRRRLIDLTLAPVDGQVEVHFALNGIPHVVRRHAASGEVQLKVGDRPMAPASEAEVRSLLPVRAYSQRQLSDVGVDLDELRRFVTAPIRDRLTELASRRDELSNQIRENFVHLQRRRALDRSIARDRLSLESLGQQASSVRDALGGLSAADQDILRAKPGYDAGQALIEGWAARLDQAATELERSAAAVGQLASGMPSATATSTSLPEREILEAGHAEVRTLLADARSAAEAAATRLRESLQTGSPFDGVRGQWSQRHTAFSIQYRDATARSTAHAAKLSELEELERRRAELQQSLEAQEQQRSMLGDPDARHEQLRTQWRVMARERTGYLQEQCDALTEMSDGLIRATMVIGAGTVTQQERFKRELQGSGVRAAKIEAFFDGVGHAGDPLEEWHAALDELEQIVLALGEAVPPPVPRTALQAFASADLAKMAPKLTPEAILGLCLLQPDDHPEFLYRSKEGEYIPFADASAGQQATALLRVLLNQGGPPLVIDQPEDDLDSQVIQEVVDLIWDAKGRRQLIFSSHNANLVVNGDAELVACFNYRTLTDHSAGQIEVEGAIDIPAVRERITAVMEGGEKAFLLRKDKYGF